MGRAVIFAQSGNITPWTRRATPKNTTQFEKSHFSRPSAVRQQTALLLRHRRLWGPTCNLPIPARQIGPEQPFFGLQPPKKGNAQEAGTKIELLASDYITALRNAQPEGPYYLGGYCTGGLVTFEIAQQLKAQGERVELLALLDTPHTISGLTYKVYSFLQKRIAKYLPDTRRNQPRPIQIATGLFNDEGLNANMEALRHYAPRPYPGRITLFLSTWSLIRLSHMRGHWRRIAGDGLDIIRVPGDHDNFVRGKNATILAQHLRTCLDEAQSTLAQQKNGS